MKQDFFFGLHLDVVTEFKGQNQHIQTYLLKSVPFAFQNIYRGILAFPLRGHLPPGDIGTPETDLH